MRGKNGKSKTNQGKEKLRQMETERLYQNSLHIFEEFKRRTFMSPNIRSIFLSSYNTYNLKGNLRFELAPESEENFQKRIEVAKDRAKTLYNEVFSDEKELQLIITASKFSGAGLIRKYLYKANYQIVDSFTTSAFDSYYENKATILVMNTQRNNVRIAKIIDGLCYRDFNEVGKLRVSDNLFLYNSKTNTIVNIYDDRGCDIWSNNFQSQKKLYDKFNDWILEYDKNEIDLFYSNIDRV
ncbi:hypothetical protein C2L98_05110 [Enterococcus gallinarum]|nr:hypothetical protein C2L98_05110 [Enterococcus gallinarum]TFV16086.1 DUF3885 domain-containing protein [Enterococcus gallinarum]